MICLLPVLRAVLFSILVACEGSNDAQLLIQRYADSQGVEVESLAAQPDAAWPDCLLQNTRIKVHEGEELSADLTDYGAPKTGAGCANDDCSDTDELFEEKAELCALKCATVTNCRFWNWGPEASKNKCWLRTGDKGKTTTPAEAQGFVTGARQCRPPVNLAEAFDASPTAQVLTFKGHSCPNGSQGLELSGDNFVRLGNTKDGNSYYFSKTQQVWLYYDKNCNGESGEDKWAPQWVLTPEAPNPSRDEDLDGDGRCAASGYSGAQAELFGVSSGANWQVDCSGPDWPNSGNTTLGFMVDRTGLRAQFWKNMDAPAGRGPADFSRTDARLDYWATSNGWDGLGEHFKTANFYAVWNGYLKISKAGDYAFSLGSSDDATLQWADPASDTWARFDHKVAGGFEYSGAVDFTPETMRTMEDGVHQLAISFTRTNTGPMGLVFKYKGADTNNKWQVVPTSVLSPDGPACGWPADAKCAEGFRTNPGESCTLQCNNGGDATPSVVQCSASGASASFPFFKCGEAPTTTTTEPAPSMWEAFGNSGGGAEAAPEAVPGNTGAAVPAPPPPPPAGVTPCFQEGARIKGGTDGDLFADLIDYGGAKGCKDNDCSDSDEMELSDMKSCSQLCASVRNCRFWTWGPEASVHKCWLRTSDASLTVLPAEAAGFITGPRDCSPPADFEEDAAPPSANTLTFEGPDCASSTSEGLNGKKFHRVGDSGGRAFYYSKKSKDWLYWEDKCMGPTMDGAAEFPPSWVVSNVAPSVARQQRNFNGAMKCQALAFNDAPGDFDGPVSGTWNVDCIANGSTPTYERFDFAVRKVGVVAKFWKARSDGLGDSGAEPDIKRLDARLDYWLTKSGWDGLPKDWDEYQVQWTGFLQVKKAGDYDFTLGSACWATLKWYDEASDTWAMFDLKPKGEFAYSSTSDFTPETRRTLAAGYHKFTIEMRQNKQSPAGLVFKWKGKDSGDAWRVIPSNAFAPVRP